MHGWGGKISKMRILIKKLLACAVIILLAEQVLYAQSSGWVLIFPPIMRIPTVNRQGIYQSEQECLDVASGLRSKSSVPEYYLCDPTVEGWQLTGPYFTLTIGYDQPLKKWQIHKAYDTAKECEADRIQ